MNSSHDVPFKLPQSGWRLDEEFYSPLGIEQSTFRRKLRECGVPFSEFGNSVLLNAEDFYPSLPKFLQLSKEKGSGKSVERRQRS